MAALQYIDIPDYHALIIRRTYKDLSLPGAIMDRALTWLLNYPDIHWSAAEKKFTFPSGATLTFGYCQTERDVHQYDSAEFQFIGFDEVTQFTEFQYRYLFSRLRRGQGSLIPLRLRCASNPSGVGHEWVKRRFVDPGSPERPFIPAKLDDNPFIDRDDYRKSLANLDPVTRERLLNGDWDVLQEGRLFKREWFDGKIIDTAPNDVFWIRSWDRAATEPGPGKDPDWTAGGLIGLTPSGQWYLRDVIRFQGTPLDNKRRIAQVAERDGALTPIVIEREGGSSGKDVEDDYKRNVLVGYNATFVSPTGKKVDRAGIVSSAAEAGNLFLVRDEKARPWIATYLDELAAFPQAGVHDDQVDMTSQGFNAHFDTSRKVNLGIFGAI